MNYDISSLLSREQDEQFGPISGAELGMSRLSGGRKFADEFFDPKKALFEPEELTDLLGTRFLARKIKDVPAHVPALDLVHSDVSLAWKTAKARPLAEKAAVDLADQLKKKKDPIKDATIEGYRVVTIPPITRRQTNFMASQFGSAPAEETPIPEVPRAGDAFRKAYFGLQPGTVAVAPDQPHAIYYVMVPERREPATFAALYAPNGDELRYKMFARDQAARQLDQEWMGWLRDKAGLAADWIPADESKGKTTEDDA
jgi:peptidyl-prolyl cis-trans isomerase D